MIKPFFALGLSALPIAWLAMATHAAAQGARPARIAEVQQEVRSACQGRVRFGRGFHRTADFNADGRPDHIIDTGAAECAGGMNPFCGSAGCVLEILISGTGRYRDGFNDNVRTWSVRRRGNRDVLVLDLHGSACGHFGTTRCRQIFAWNGRHLAPLSGSP